MSTEAMSGWTTGCPNCSGRGESPNPTHETFWRAARYHVFGIWAIGDSEPERRSLAGFDLGPPKGPRYVRCARCGGRGVVLTRDGRRLLRFVRAWADVPDDELGGPGPAAVFDSTPTAAEDRA